VADTEVGKPRDVRGFSWTPFELIDLRQELAGLAFGTQPDFAALALGLNIVRLPRVVLQGSSPVADVLECPASSPGIALNMR
jgi:hypothetical protein